MALDRLTSSQLLLCLVTGLSASILGFVSSSLRLLSSTRSADFELFEHPLEAALHLLEDRTTGSVRAVLEVLSVLSCESFQLIRSRPLIRLDAVRIKVALELRVRP